MLTPVNSKDIDLVWPRVSVYVELALDKSPWPIKLDKVKEVLKEGGSHKLFLISQGGVYVGAGIINIYEDLGVKVMNVYSMSYDPGYEEHELDLKQVETMAAAVHCDVISFYGRPGFTRTHPKLGFKQAQTIMIKEV